MGWGAGKWCLWFLNSWREGTEGEGGEKGGSYRDRSGRMSGEGGSEEGKQAPDSTWMAEVNNMPPPCLKHTTARRGASMG